MIHPLSITISLQCEGLIVTESIRLRLFAAVLLSELSDIHDSVTNVCFNVLTTRTGNLALSSMASSRVFIDKDIQPTIDYFSWLVTVETTVLCLSIPISVLFRLN